ncbi:MAPEG family protein [Sphingopyxis sp. PAMC25046]|uniref:MAPEG family protein n=1 Tax=Sphingopyxis sp. PAMC25046 TaxID=2565556 RepID=UPI00109DD585|nr:MAPEG family protein [Sphingopyxis sp. PAMC25046]QCB54941.1 MAPEG family protein [Sphingopyxis sp. PAMC25046]
MDTNDILGPVAALALWSMVMWVWMYATRLPAMSRAKIDTANLVGGTGQNLENVLPPQVQWKAHNYNHLMEQPTVFYAVAIALAVGGMGGGLNTQIAWAYVALRIVHSLIQVTVNRVMWRFLVFALASLALFALCLHAFMGFVLH